MAQDYILLLSFCKDLLLNSSRQHVRSFRVVWVLPSVRQIMFTPAPCYIIACSDIVMTPDYFPRAMHLKAFFY